MAAPVITAGPIAGDPLATVEHLIGGPAVDSLLTAAARRAPGKPALCDADEDLTFAELDRRASRLAAALQPITSPGTVVALAAVLAPVFGVGFFGVARAGAIPALVNPLLREDALVRALQMSGARAAIVPPSVYRRLAEVRDQLPELDLIVLTHREAGAAAQDGVPTVAELIGGAPADSVAPLTVEPGDVACIQFTSGTTGNAKVVQLSHRNLTVNAAQAAAGHRTLGDAVIFNNLPTFHLMHLVIGLVGTVTHVVCDAADGAEAMRTARGRGATHFYSLPVRLTFLARHPELTELQVPTLRAVLSGGSALPRATGEALAAQFAVPIVQGYGLQETSPLLTFDDLDDSAPGSSGRPAAGTEVRIVDIATRAVLGTGEKGEIQVRGPQLMVGYLGSDEPYTDADGWFTTGDVGYLDPVGRLFVADRIKDVYKCDNWLVSPADIENALLRHPGVVDCVVFDHPHDASGAVAHAVVVPRDWDVDPEDLKAFIAARLPYYEHLHHVDLALGVPRSPTGKVQRRELRDRYLNPATVPPYPEGDKVFVFINQISVTGDVPEFDELIKQLSEHVRQQPGFRSYKLFQSGVDAGQFVEVVEWADAQSHLDAATGPGFINPITKMRELATARPGPFVLRREYSAALTS